MNESMRIELASRCSVTSFQSITAVVTLYCVYAFSLCLSAVIVCVVCQPVPAPYWNNSNVRFYDDWPHEGLLLPFVFPFYGQAIRAIYLSPNGGIHFSRTIPCCVGNWCLFWSYPYERQKDTMRDTDTQCDQPAPLSDYTLIVMLMY